MKSYSLRESEIIRRLQSRGLRNTRPRRLVYRALYEMGGHRSVDDIVKELQKRGTPLVRMTVYNVIADLERVGLVMLADTGPGRSLYEISDRNHHHFVCRECKSIFDVECVEEYRPCIFPKFDAGEIEEAQIIFRGLCNKCRERRDSQSSSSTHPVVDNSP